jgi:hypothetical protein
VKLPNKPANARVALLRRGPVVARPQDANLTIAIASHVIYLDEIDARARTAEQTGECTTPLD